MIYFILGYVLLYLVSAYLLIEDWTEDLDLYVDNLLVLLLASIVLVGLFIGPPLLYKKCFGSKRILIKKKTVQND